MRNFYLLICWIFFSGEYQLQPLVSDHLPPVPLLTTLAPLPMEMELKSHLVLAQLPKQE